ncbi:glycosyltransferase family 39 protein [Rhizobium sp. RU20A]|uniref:ArnT family glycosyltransferase n=1 Tax=Rhizobium sp. RU20A TaxID=1907412 RepID=UPI0032AF1266
MTVPTERAGAGWLPAALGIVGAITLVRVLVLAMDGRDLFVDEAQYWLWSQHMELGYYSKPPLIAWAIAASTALGGSDAPFWVRLPGPLCHGVTALLLAALAARHGGRMAALRTALAYATLPMVGLGSLVISTDTIMAPFFAAALLFHDRLLSEGRARDAVLTGLMIGLACLAKYAGLYVLLGIAMAAIADRRARPTAVNGLLIAAALLLVLSPNLAWNALNHGETLSHTADNIGWVRQASPFAGFGLDGLAEFLASQFGVFGPGLMVALIVSLLRGLGRKGDAAQAAAMAPRQFVWFVWPILAVVSVQALMDKAYANWAAGAYLAGTLIALSVLAAWPRLRTIAIGINAATCLVLLVMTALPTVGAAGNVFTARYLGRAAMSKTLMDLARREGTAAIVSDNRDILADLFYTGRNASDLAFYARPSGAGARNHYEMRYPLPQTFAGAVLLVTEHPPACAGRPLAIDTAGGAYARRTIAAYRTDAGCAGRK